MAECDADTEHEEDDRPEDDPSDVRRQGDPQRHGGGYAEIRNDGSHKRKLFDGWVVNDGLYDEAGDTPPTGGFREPERRQGSRRQEDVIVHEMETWTARLFVHRGKLVFMASLATFLFTSLGFRILGPSQDLKALDQKFTARDSVMNIRVTRMEEGQAQIRDQLANIAESVRFIVYIQCTNIPRDARPATCYAKGGP